MILILAEMQPNFDNAHRLAHHILPRSSSPMYIFAIQTHRLSFSFHKPVDI